MLVARVVIGLTREIEDEIWEQAFSGKFHLKLPYFAQPKDNPEGHLHIDTFTNEDKTIFIKTNLNEVYPEQVLVYRDKTGEWWTQLPRDNIEFGIKTRFITLRKKYLWRRNLITRRWNTFKNTNSFESSMYTWRYTQILKRCFTLKFLTMNDSWRNVELFYKLYSNVHLHLCL